MVFLPFFHNLILNAHVGEKPNTHLFLHICMLIYVETKMKKLLSHTFMNSKDMQPFLVIYTFFCFRNSEQH